MKSYFYVIVNKITGQRYYGSGSKKNYFGSSNYLKNSIKKYGIDNFEKNILRYFKTREDAFVFEDRFLKLYKISSLPNTYNLKDSGKGGDTISNNPNKELIKIKMSISAKSSNYLKDKKYEDFYGFEKAKEMEKKLSNSHKGKKCSQESVEKRRNFMILEWSDPDKRKKRLEKNEFILNNPAKNPEHRKKMSEERMGTNNPNAKPIQICGIEYPSIIDATRELGISRSTIQRKLKKDKNFKLLNN
jgi:hypothetical protein